MTPEQLEAARSWIAHHVRVMTDLRTPLYPTLQMNVQLLAHIDILEAQIAALQRERG